MKEAHSSRLSEAVSSILGDADKPLTLHPAVDASLFDMRGGLANAEHWKARVFVGSSVAKKGATDRIGYLMVDPASGLFIPEANSDAHRSGYEVLYDHWQKKDRSINPRDYVPVWPYSIGGTYGTLKEDAARWKLLASRWLASGGLDLVVTDSREGYAYRFSALAKGVKVGSVAKGKLTADGKRLVAAFAEVSAAIHAPTHGKSKQAKIMRSLKELASVLGSTAIQRTDVVDWGVEKALSAIVADYEGTDDLTKLEMAIFGFGGIKRGVHDRAREAAAGTGHYAYRQTAKAVASILGDPHALVAALAEL